MARNRPDKRERAERLAQVAVAVRTNRAVAVNLANMSSIIEEAKLFGVDNYVSGKVPVGAASKRELPMLGSRASVAFVHAKRIPSGKHTFARFAKKN